MAYEDRNRRPQGNQSYGGQGGNRYGQRESPVQKVAREEGEMRQKLVESFGKEYDKELLTTVNSAYNTRIEKIKKFVQGISEDVTTSQIRNVFSHVKNVKSSNELYRLRPQLAYLSGRSDKQGFKTLVLLLDDLIKEVQTQEHLEEFQSFFESIIAFHKYYGGKD